MNIPFVDFTFNRLMDQPGFFSTLLRRFERSTTVQRGIMLHRLTISDAKRLDKLMEKNDNIKALISSLTPTEHEMSAPETHREPKHETISSHSFALAIIMSLVRHAKYKKMLREMGLYDDLHATLTKLHDIEPKDSDLQVLIHASLKSMNMDGDVLMPLVSMDVMRMIEKRMSREHEGLSHQIGHHQKKDDPLEGMSLGEFEASRKKKITESARQIYIGRNMQISIMFGAIAGGWMFIRSRKMAPKQIHTLVSFVRYRIILSAAFIALASSLLNQHVWMTTADMSLLEKSSNAMEALWADPDRRKAYMQSAWSAVTTRYTPENIQATASVTLCLSFVFTMCSLMLNKYSLPCAVAMYALFGRQHLPTLVIHVQRGEDQNKQE